MPLLMLQIWYVKGRASKGSPPRNAVFSYGKASSCFFRVVTIVRRAVQFAATFICKVDGCVVGAEVVAYHQQHVVQQSVGIDARQNHLRRLLQDGYFTNAGMDRSHRQRAFY